MSDGFEKKLVTPAGYLSGLFAIVAFATFSLFVFEIGRRGLYAVVGWDYNFRSIADTLNLDNNKGLVGWDRAFLLLAIAVGAFYAASGVESFVEWAKKSPEQREVDRERSAKAFADLKATQDEEKQRLETEKAERKAARKPMSGWRRLWIVLSLVFGAFAAMLTWDPTHTEYVTLEAGQFTTWDNFWKLPKVEAATKNCGAGRVRGEYGWGGDTSPTYTLECPAKDPLGTSLLWALLPAVVMAAVGLIVRWIYRGFRPKPAA